MNPSLEGKSAKLGFLILTLSVFVLFLFLFSEKVNAAVFGSVTIQVAVANGSADSSDFDIRIRKVSGIGFGNLQAAGDIVTFGMLSPGTYLVTSSGPSGYSASWSGDCNAQGEVIIEAGAAKQCTLTETFAVPPPSGGGDSGGGGDTPTPAPETRRGGSIVGSGRSR